MALCHRWYRSGEVDVLEESQEWFSSFCSGVLAYLPTKRFMTVKMGASFFSYRSMRFWSETPYLTGFPVKSQKLNTWAQCPRWKTEFRCFGSIWVFQVVAESSQFLGHIALKIETTRELPSAFLLKRKSSLICQTGCHFLILHLIEKARKRNSCLSFETLCASQFSSPTSLFDQRLLIAL